MVWRASAGAIERRTFSTRTGAQRGSVGAARTTALGQSEADGEGSMAIDFID
jgi:hypothetical protein